MTLELLDVTASVGRGDSRTAVWENVSALFPAGETTALTGPSGSGKSTLLAVAGTLLRPDAGKVLLDGCDLAALGPAERARARRERIGYLFQSGNLIEGLTAVEQLVAAQSVTGRRRDRAHATDLLTSVGLDHRLRHRAEELSGGERQRVALARALLLEPQLLLVDEPTAAVDRSQAGRLAELIADTTRASGCVTVVATHDPAVEEAADRVVSMASLSRSRP